MSKAIERNRPIVGAAMVFAGIATGNPWLAMIGASLLLPLPKLPADGGERISGALVSAPNPTAARRIIYGAPRVGGVVTFLHVSGENNEYLNQVVTFAGHEVTAFDELYLDGELVPLDGGGDATGRFAGYVHAEFALGTAAQAALAALRVETRPAWLTDGGLRFDGRGQTMYTAATTAFHLATITIEGYLRFNNRPEVGQRVLRCYGASSALSWEVYVGNEPTEDHFQLSFKDSGGDTHTSSRALEIGTWYWFAFRGSGAAMSSKIDLHAIESTAVAFTPGSGAGKLWAASADGAGSFAPVDLDNLRVWSVVRSGAQIEADLGVDLDGTQANLVGNWLANEGSGLKVADNAGSNEEFTLEESWGANHRQRGCAYAWVRTKHSPTLFPRGMPNVTARIRGRAVWDSRTGTTAYSDNPALAIADYLISYMGKAQTDIATTPLNAAANACEEAVALAAGGTEERYRADALLSMDDAHANNLEILLAAMGGEITIAEGKRHIYAGVWRAPTLTLDESDLRGDLRVSRRHTFNAVRGLHPNPDEGWEAGDVPPITNATYETEDGGRRVYQDVHLPAVASTTQAQRLAKIILEAERQDIVVQWPGRLAPFQLLPGETVNLTVARLGWTAKPFRVLRGELAIDAQEDTGGAAEIGYDLLLRETASGVYDWASGEETQVDLAKNSNLPNPRRCLAPTGLTLTSGTAELYLRLDGTVHSRIKATWTAPTDQYVTSGGRIEIAYKLSSAGTWQHAGFVDGAQTFAWVLDVQDGAAYDVRVRSINSLNVASRWTTATGHTVAGKTMPPANVTAFKAFQNGLAATFVWDQVADLDLAGYEIRYGLAGVAWADANPLTRVVRGTRVTDAAVPPGPKAAGGARQAWRFQIKAIDTSGNESPDAATADLTIEPAYDAIYRVDQAPLWRGTRTNYHRNPRTGHLNPTSADADSTGDNFNVFDNYVTNAQPSSAYEAAEIDIGFDDRARVWAEFEGGLGPGASGPIAPVVGADYRLAAGSYDGFEEPWGVGEATARYFKLRFAADNANEPLTVARQFTPVVDLLEHEETVTGVTVAVGGTTVAFGKAFRLKPEVAVTSTANTAVHFGVTTTNFLCWVLDAGGADVGGTIAYTATGV